MTIPATEAAAASGLDFHELPTVGVTIKAMPASVASIVGRGVDAITLGRTVIVSPRRFGSVVGGEAAELLAHELVHVRQWSALGVFGFLRSYVTDYVRLRILGLSHFAAYRHIGLEWAAYDEARRIVRTL